MKMYLIGKDLWEIVTGAEVAEEAWTETQNRNFKKRENQALAAICLAISTNLQIYVRSSKTAKEAWDNLEKHFQQKTLSKKIFYRRKLYSARMEKGQNMVEHINNIKTLAEHLEAIDDAIVEKDIVILLISSLPDEYNHLITALETLADTNLTWDYVRDRLIHESEKMKPDVATTNDALFTSRRSKSDLKCHYCQKKGHFARDCYKKKKDMKTSSANVVKDENETVEELALKSSNDSSKGNWWIDSGATQHMTFQKDDIENYTTFKAPLKVKLADDSTVNSYGKGQVRLSLSSEDGKVNLVLKEVLFVPDLQNKLFSLPTVTGQGTSVEFKGSKCRIEANGKQHTIGSKHGKLYRLNTSTEENCCLGKSQNEEPKELWHQRFGHLGHNNLKLLKDREMVDGLHMDPTHIDDECRKNCEGCAMGKQHRLPFSTKTATSSTKLLELIHSDVCGPMNIPSIGGSRYFVTFIDDFSRYVTVYMMEKKSEVFYRFKDYITLIENRTGTKVKQVNFENQTVKRFRSDNGGEYTSKEFENFCRGRGIKLEPTIPYTPQQNGVAERMNRTLTETARSMLHHSGRPLNLWAEAISTAAYVRNRSPTTILKDVTPYELWFGKKPDVGNLKVFGCKAFVHVPDSKRKGKFETKSTRCIFVGYPTNENGFKLYNPSAGKMLRSRDVIFIENQFDSDTCGNPEKDYEFFNEHSFAERNAEPEEEPVGEEQQNAPPVDQNIPTRPTRARRPPERLDVLTGDWWNFIEHASIATSNSNEPATINQALNGPNSKQWSKAVQCEFDSLKENGTWDLVDLPPGKNLVGSKWTFKHKRGPGGEITRYKARLVAQGFSQQHGVDYDEVFAPVAKFSSIRSVLAIANQLDLDVHQMDVKTAFLNGNLEEEIFMKQPEGFADKKHPNMVCKLRKGLYGLKQSARCWNKVIDEYLKESGFKQNDADACIYVKRFKKGDKEVVLLVAVYVDDLLIASNDLQSIAEEKRRLSSRFEMEDLGEANFCLGMSIKRDRSNGLLNINQRAYLEAVLKRFGMDDCKPVTTPLEVGTKFEKLSEDEEPLNLREYQSAIGSLIYASIGTRPDISAAVGMLSQHTSKPGKDHWIGVKRVFRYIKGTLDYGLIYSAKDNNTQIVGYADADWAGDVNTRKSTSGYAFQIGGSTISWMSKRQSTVALSTTEAEYVALSTATQEAIWLRSLLKGMGFAQKSPTTIFEDNQGTIALAKNPIRQPRTKHIDIKYHFTRDAITKGETQLTYCPTNLMVADILTKAIPRHQFEELRKKLGVSKL